MYSWAWIPITGSTGHAWVLLRRNDTTGEIAYYRTFSPRPVPLPTLVKVAGQRWRVEECFQTSKGLTGLDQHQVRRWTSWHRWVTLAMLAHAFLTVITAEERAARPAPDGLIPITVNELRRLFDALLLRPNHTPQRLQSMVTLAPTTPSPSPRLPLPPTRRITMITNYDSNWGPGGCRSEARVVSTGWSFTPDDRHHSCLSADRDRSSSPCHLRWPRLPQPFPRTCHPDTARLASVRRRRGLNVVVPVNNPL